MIDLLYVSISLVHILQDEGNGNFLIIYKEGSNNSEIMANLSGNAFHYDDVLVPGNQMFMTYEAKDIGPQTKLLIKIHKSQFNELLLNK